VQNILSWVKRIQRVCPLRAISLELVRFDTQLMQDPEISGKEYQQGTLQGYEVREYLLEKWDRACAYCGVRDVPLEIEHILCKKRGGSDRISNLTLACEPCNKAKGALLIEQFLKKKPDVLKRILTQAKASLRDVAAVNTTRWELYQRLQGCGLPVEIGTGGRTKYNRCSRKMPKTHWLDAACVGASTSEYANWQSIVPLQITATGRHSRQMCRMNRYGFPEKAPKASSVIGGLRTGDMVRAVVPSGKYKGIHRGRIAIRSSGFCNIQTRQKTLQGVHYRHCHPLHRGDGYSYEKGAMALPSQL
jgi:5-methylcytosine-specific restriction endonuclease McrA